MSDGLSSDSAYSTDEEAERQLPHVYVLLQSSGALIAHRVLVPRATLTISGLHQILMTQHPQLQRHRRLALHNLGGHYIDPSTRFFPEHFQGFLAIPDPGFGSNNKKAVDSDGYSAALTTAKRAVGDAQRPAQIRLLLRGEPGLVERINKNANDVPRCKQIILDLCRRYGMGTTAQSGPPPISMPKQASAAASPPVRKTTPVARTAPAALHELLEQDWSVPIVKEITFNAPGIYFPTTQADAVSLIKRLGRPDHAVGVLCIRPIPEAPHCQPLTFRALTTDSQGRVRERALQGYLNQPGQQHVAYRDNTVHIPKLPESSVSVKITLRSAAKHLNEQQWQTLRQIKDRKSLQALVDEKRLHLIDMWDLRQEDGEWLAQVRIKRGQLEAWLAADLPFGVGLAGDLANLHRIIWDPDLRTLNEGRKRYGDTPGFCGVVVSKAGIGARIESASFSAAMQHLGRPVGDLFEIKGVPLSATADTVREVIDHISWPATLQESYRKVQQGQATYRLRAEVPPTCELIKTCINQEIVHLQIARIHARRQVNRAAEKHAAAPQSWEQAAKQAIGIQKKPAPEAVEPAHFHEGEFDDPGDMDAEFMAEEAPTAQTHTAPQKTWARRLHEPAAKLRRTEAGAEPGADPRVDTLVQQMEKVMSLLQGLAGNSITTDPAL